MPGSLDPADFGAWLDPGSGDGRELLKPCPDEWLEAYPAPTHVNKPANDYEQCIEWIE